MVRSPRTARNRIPWVVVAVVGLFLAIVIRGQYVDYYVESLVDESYERSDYQGLETPSGILTLKPTLPAKSTPTPITPTVAEKPPVALPLKVPFTSQAPLTIWDPLHEEACEEASLLMVYYYRTGQKFVSPLAADTEIKKLVAWEEQNGYKVDLTVKELVAVASGYMKLKTGRVIVDPTVDQLKAELKAGRPVIVPAAGREL
ncbi:MAG: C39 family peptidase, partial [bacterium]|nr:C39 family peptidase [bacterium]